MKRGYLGIFEGTYIAGQSAAVQLVLQQQGVAAAHDIIPLEQMIYIAAFQGGIERFVTSMKAASDHPMDRFVSARLSAPKQSVPQLFEKLLPFRLTLPEDKAHKTSASMALSFVYDLIVAMQNNAAVMNVSGIPTLADVRRDFPPDIALPICTILSALKGTDELLPAPSKVVSRETVDRFRELLNSDVYHRYTAAHERVENETVEPALSDIRTRGVELLRAGRGVLTNQRLSMNIISVVPKIVDAAFGKLPGALAQFAGDLASKFMDARRNIVIYQFNDWTKDYMEAVIFRSLRNRINVTK
jgi:hypothetical protein